MGKTALVVDDSPSIRQLVGFTLQEAGFEVIQAGEGKQALEALGGRPIQLVITDLNMPVMDGLALIRSLRAQPAYRFVPILMLTTESQESKKLEGKAAGATGWIVKPFTPDTLLQVVARVVR